MRYTGLRDLHAELEKWNEDALTEWDPGPGDILVGVVKGPSPAGERAAGLQTVTVQEEKTGTLVLVRIDSPELARLFKLQSPSVGERIGLKYAGKSRETDERRYVLMVDREHTPGGAETLEADPADYPEAGAAPTQPDDADTDEVLGATPEERLFIEQSLRSPTGSPETSSSTDSSAAQEAPLREIIRRQDDEIRRQAETLEKLERMLLTAIPLIGGKPAPQADAAAEDRPGAVQPGSDSDTGAHPDSAGVNWQRVCLAVLALAASCALGTAAHFLLHIP